MSAQQNATLKAWSRPTSSAVARQHGGKGEAFARRAVLKHIKDLDLAPPHPGEILREDMLPRLDLAPDGLAGRLDLPTDAIAELLAERRPVTAEIAAKLAATFGHSSRFWLGLQMQYDRWLAAGPTG